MGDPLLPVAGDPFAVSSVGSSLTSIAQDVAAQASRLRSIGAASWGDASWTGAASSAARSRVATLPPMLDRAHESYAAAGSALASYARSLDAAQERSESARSTASRASADLDAARFAQAAAVIADSQAVVLSGLATATAPRHQAAIVEAADRLKRAVALNDEAHDDQQAAARALAISLRQASRLGIRNASWLHHTTHAVGSWASSQWVAGLRAASKVGQLIAVGAGLVALVLALGGAFFPPLEVFAAGFEMASVTGAEVATVADVGLAASGHGSWTAVGTDALSVLPAGAGRLVTKAVPALREGRFLVPTTVVHASTGTPSMSVQELRATWGQPRTFFQHFNDHGGDFGANTFDEYIQQGHELLKESQAGMHVTKVDATGVIRVYDPATERFGAYNSDLTTRTFFRPNPESHGLADNWSYWLTQEGS